jgi:UPF0237 protein cthe_0409
MIKAVLTVIGCDRVGIIAAITGYLAQVNVNVLDISQTIMDDIFTMVMLVDVSAASENFNNIAGKIKKMGSELGLQMQLQHVDIFNSMHKI